MNYKDFLLSKQNSSSNSGFDIKEEKLNPMCFDFQRYIIKKAIKRGNSAIFADCGLGKTLMELDFCNQIVRHTNKPALILTPLAVSYQMVRESEKFKIECKRSNDGKITGDIMVTNYERLKYFDKNDFSCVVCDESSILKSFDGSFKSEITEFMKKIPFRLLATATAAPNDYIELGTSSECIGNLGYMDMLNKYFKNDLNNSSTRRMYGEAPKWRFKGHSELPFWRWVCSWATACRKPSDLGYDDEKFILPELIENYRFVHTEEKPSDMLFNMPATNLIEQRDEKKRTITDRCERVAELVDTKKSALVWCHLNDEGNYLKQVIKDSVQISGSEKDEAKEEKFLDFINGKTRVLITKPKIGAWGLNFQHCSHLTYFPSHSYEQYYQAVRRCLRFGQKHKVTVDIIHTEGERKIMENMKRKSIQADKMFQNLVNEMNNVINHTKIDEYTKMGVLPKWL